MKRQPVARSPWMWLGLAGVAGLGVYLLARRSAAAATVPGLGDATGTSASDAFNPVGDTGAAPTDVPAPDTTAPDTSPPAPARTSRSPGSRPSVRDTASTPHAGTVAPAPAPAPAAPPVTPPTPTLSTVGAQYARGIQTKLRDSGVCPYMPITGLWDDYTVSMTRVFMSHHGVAVPEPIPPAGTPTDTQLQRLYSTMITDDMNYPTDPQCAPL